MLLPEADPIRVMSEHKISTSKMATLLGCTKQAISLWKTGKRKPGALYKYKAHLIQSQNSDQ